MGMMFQGCHSTRRRAAEMEVMVLFDVWQYSEVWLKVFCPIMHGHQSLT